MADRAICNGSVALSIEGPDATAAPAETALHNGWGSGLPAIAGTGDVALAAAFGGLGASVVLQKADASVSLSRSGVGSRPWSKGMRGTADTSRAK